MLIKKISPLLSAILFSSYILSAQNTTPDTGNKTAKPQVTATDTGNKQGKPETGKTPNPATSNDNNQNKTGAENKGGNSCNDCEITWQQWLLIFAPVLLILVAFNYVLRKMKKDKFSIASALSSGQMEERTTTETGADGQPKTITYKENLGSASRTIAFFTGITAIFIAACLTTFEGYHIVAGNNSQLDFDGLWKILGALGIGVIPYGINVWNGNAKEK